MGAFFVQTILLPALGIERVAPDFLLAAVTGIALVTAPAPAIGFGAFGGLLQDSFSGGFLGMNGFSKPLVAFMVARCRRHPLVGPSLGVPGALVLLVAAAAADAVVLSVLGKVTGLAAISGGRWLAVGLGIPVTAAAGLVVFRVLARGSRGRLH